MQPDQYPEILKVDHIAKILDISKRRAYEVMEYKGFPLIRIGRLKRVEREAFFQWIKKEARQEEEVIWVKRKRTC
ncbi:excisionase family DNA binding protein [Croceifilum oryzae]|uniref:Excisionase family DNA binding protein n=1 Tax=Croceifilum oryzae TaxID=1553429 RepID=A0AAJ1TN27_9BACL|nr:helix-turn-helix domain-containing protein [Croceifilum oryzae]MDQ0417571.1 excisionase family DNA binding protein [Croceifilum oryzae]